MKREHGNDRQGSPEGRSPRIEEIDRPIDQLPPDVAIKDLTWDDVQGTWEQQGETTWDDAKGAA